VDELDADVGAAFGYFERAVQFPGCGSDVVGCESEVVRVLLQQWAAQPGSSDTGFLTELVDD
jgi:hypothetical protein